jgi:2-polyprenyl-3-methyl-5-hydroxy-6-metoxy-1,4-benzoquinol methylase
MLDIGSGLGVFPAAMSRMGVDVTCVEPNKDSADFIKNDLKLECLNQFYDGPVDGEFDLVTLVHVLEHEEAPIRMLTAVRENLKEDGWLFIEVPDAEEFRYLPKEHDEFNSCHVVFYDMASLFHVMVNAGFLVHIMASVRTKVRDLSRIMLLAKKYGK